MHVVIQTDPLPPGYEIPTSGSPSRNLFIGRCHKLRILREAQRWYRSCTVQHWTVMLYRGENSDA